MLSISYIMQELPTQLHPSTRHIGSHQPDSMSSLCYITAPYPKGNVVNRNPRLDPAPLPKSRVQDLPPFAVTSIDFTRALYVCDNNEETIVYICLFTCANTWAVHLEVVSDLTTDMFLLAFRRFASCKSLPQVMMSDNSFTCTSAAEELSTLLQSEDLMTALYSYLSLVNDFQLHSSFSDCCNNYT